MATKKKAKTKAWNAKEEKASGSRGRKAIAAICIVLALVIVGFGVFIGIRVWKNPSRHEHTFENGVCSACSYVCEHDYQDGACKVCGVDCAHEYEKKSHDCSVCDYVSPHKYKDSVCTVCEKKCLHELYENGVCVACDFECSHDFEEGSHECKVCDYISHHVYADGEHDCQICGKGVNHFYAIGGHECAVCGEKTPHEYDEGSHLCKVCGETSPHDWVKGVCTVCGEVCEHQNENDVCKVCGISLLEYAVTFDSDGGTEIPHATVLRNFTVSEPEPPVKEGCVFGGWYTDENCTAAYDFDAEVKGHMTLYAKWTVATFTVSFNLMKSDDSVPETSGVYAPQTVTYGETASAPASDPTRTYKTFGGWYTDLEYTNAFEFTETITADTTLYVKWNNVYYNVTLSLTTSAAIELGGEVQEGTATFAAVAGETLTIENEPTKEGYTFKGWFTNSKCTTAYDFTKVVTKNFTLYALWAVAYHTVEFNPEGAGSDVTTRSVRYGNTVVAPSVTWAGHTFCGWYTHEEVPEGADLESYLHDAEHYLKYEESGEIYYCTKVDLTAPITADYVLYARWHECDEGSHYCKNCHEMTPHVYQNGVCTVCGACETHDYSDGVCTRCYAHEIVYTGISELNLFMSEYPELFPVSGKEGETVTLAFGDPIELTTAEGVVIRITVTSCYITRYTQMGDEEEIATLNAENGWSFVVPEENGTIMVMLNGAEEHVLPEGYHTIAVNIEHEPGSMEGGVYIVEAPKYAKEGDYVKVSILSSMPGEGGTEAPEINGASFTQTTGIADYYFINNGTELIVFFKVTGDVNATISLS